MAVTETKATVTKEQIGRIDHFVRMLVPLSRSKLNGLIENGCVTINGKVCSASETRVAKGDKVVVSYDPHQGYSTKPKAWSDRTFTIIHEDDELLVVNKTAGVLTLPTKKEETNTLHHRLSAYLGRKKKNHEAAVIHRLDRGMSGVMVFAKTPAAATHLRTQFDNDEAGRLFIAIVHDVVAADEGTLESWLDTHNNLNRFSTNDKNVGQHAVTRFKVLKRMRDASALELQLLTARRHQARVQLYEAGHRIVGDDRYRDDKDEPHERWKSKRMAIHASELSFIHPGTNKQATYLSELPTPMKKFLRFRPLAT
jgi:23S rRNA pseudouridine1911/1915/1917 synthase